MVQYVENTCGGHNLGKGNPGVGEYIYVSTKTESGETVIIDAAFTLEEDAWRYAVALAEELVDDFTTEQLVGDEGNEPTYTIDHQVGKSVTVDQRWTTSSGQSLLFNRHVFKVVKVRLNRN